MSRPAVGRLVAVALLVAAPVGAQMAPGTRSVAMGGGGMVFANGVDAVEWNPANLGWAGGWNLSLGEIGVVGAADGIGRDDLEVILTSDGNTDQALANLPTRGLRAVVVSEGFATAYGADAADFPAPGSPLPTVGLSIGPVGVRVRSRVFSEVTIGSDLADLFANGYAPENLLDYAVGNTGWRSATLTEYTAAYGTTVGRLSVGVAGRYVQGQNLIDGRFFEPEIDLNAQTLSIQSVAVQSTSGTGYGLDFGLSLELPAGFRASAAGSNVLQKMTWDDGLTAWTATYTDQDFDADIAYEDFLNRFQDAPVDPDGVGLAVYEAGSRLFEGAYFPQVYRAGLGWQWRGTTIEGTGIVVSPRGRFSSEWDERISLGLEQKIPLLTLRAGYAMASEGLTTYTGGVALRFGPVHLEGSAGLFGGERANEPWEGVYGSFGIQIKGGGL